MKKLRNDIFPAREDVLSYHAKKAAERNMGCRESLARELKEVEMKRKASLREIILKQDAFIKRQLNRQSQVLTENTASRRMSLDVSRLTNNGAVHQHIRRQSLSVLHHLQISPPVDDASSVSITAKKQKRLSLPALPKYEKRNKGTESSSATYVVTSEASRTSLPRLQRRCTLPNILEKHSSGDAG